MVDIRNIFAFKFNLARRVYDEIRIIDDFVINFSKTVSDGFDDSPFCCDFGGGELVI